MEVTIKEHIDHFDMLFGRLKRNRELLPLKELQTTYAEAYGELVAELIADADWWATSFIECLALPYPPDPEDDTGNALLQQKISDIFREENAPGGLRETYLKALIEDLDRNKYEEIVVQWTNRILEEAFDPYFQRHNKWVGQPGNRWVYNDLIKKYWLPPGKDQNRKRESGRWIGLDYPGHESRFAPKIGPDPETENAA